MSNLDLFKVVEWSGTGVGQNLSSSSEFRSCVLSRDSQPCGLCLDDEWKAPGNTWPEFYGQVEAEEFCSVCMCREFIDLNLAKWMCNFGISTCILDSVGMTHKNM